jgi:hypothetical protein
MTRYVLADIEQVGTELVRRSAEVTKWLDAVATESPVGATHQPGAPDPPDSPGELAHAVAQIDLACYRALSATVARLDAAAGTLSEGTARVRDVDAEVARLLLRWGSP